MRKDGIVQVDDIDGSGGGGGGLTDAELRAAAVPVSGPLTDGQLRATPVPVNGTVTSNVGTIAGIATQATLASLLTELQLKADLIETQPVSLASVPSHPVTGPLTDTQLRAVAVPVSGTFFQGTQPVSGPVTDAQLRATAVPVSGPLTDAQLRAAALPSNLNTATDAPTRFANLGANATLNVKAAAGNVFSLYCNNENAGDRYIQLHNTATVPAGSAVPLYTFRVPAGGDVLIGTDFFTAVGARFSTGIAFAFSTTKDTYTAATAGEQTTIIHYQ